MRACFCFGCDQQTLVAKDATTSGVVDSKVASGAWRFLSLADRGGVLVAGNRVRDATLRVLENARGSMFNWHGPLQAFRACISGESWRLGTTVGWSLVAFILATGCQLAVSAPSPKPNPAASAAPKAAEQSQPVIRAIG